MKLIKCVVREEKIDETTDALRALDISGLTVSRVCGHGTCERQTMSTAACGSRAGSFPR